MIQILYPINIEKMPAIIGSIKILSYPKLKNRTKKDNKYLTLKGAD